MMWELGFHSNMLIYATSSDTPVQLLMNASKKSANYTAATQRI